MSKGSQARARFVGAAAELIQRQGFAGTGLAQIVEASGAPKGSLYFHFPGGKDELACAALNEAAAGWRRRLQDHMAKAPTAGAAIEAACVALAERLERSGYEKGCPLATTTLELATTNDPVRAVCATHYREWEAYLAAALSDLPEARSRSLATVALSAVEGALILCRAYQSSDPLLTTGAELRSLFDHAQEGSRA